MHPSFGPSATALRAAGRPAVAVLALASLTACSGQSAVPAPVPTATVTVTSTASPSSDIALTAATLTAKPTATAEQLQQSAAQLQARAKDMGLTEVKARIDGNTITVTAPGDARDKLRALTRPGQLRLRPVIAVAPSMKSLPTPTAPAATPAANTSGVKAALRTPATATPTAAATGTPSAAAAPGDPTVAFPQGTVPPELMAAFAALDCSDPGSRQDYQQVATRPAVACGADAEQDAWYKFVLGPVGVDGADIAGAKAALDGQYGAGWQVQLSFNDTGAKAFADATGRLAPQPAPANQFAIVVDGSVISHPYVRSAITSGSAVISGSFTREEAEQLASALTHHFPVELTLSDITTVPRSGGTP